MTLGEISEELDRMDGQILKAETGQVQMTWEHYSHLCRSTEELRKFYACEVSKARGGSFDKFKSWEDFYKFLIQRREITRMVSLGKMHMALHPDPPMTPEQHELLKKFYDDEDRSTEERGQILAQFNTEVYGYLFNKAPRPPAEVKTNQGGFFHRLFGR